MERYKLYVTQYDGNSFARYGFYDSPEEASAAFDALAKNPHIKHASIVNDAGTEIGVIEDGQVMF